MRKVVRNRVAGQTAKWWTLVGVLLSFALLASACSQAAPAPIAAPTAAPKAAPAPTSAPAAAGTAAPVAATQAPAAPTQAAAPAKKVDLVFGAIGAVGMIPYSAGIKLGVWDKVGINLQAIEHRGGAEVATALAGNGVQISGLDVTHVVEMNNANQGVTVFSGGFDKYAYKLLAPPGSTYKTPQSLKGKKIGISSPGSSTDNVMRWWLKSAGMDPDKDVELVAIGSGTPMLGALQNKQVDAGMTTEPVTAQLEAKSYVVVADFIKDLGPFYNNVLAAKTTWLKANAETARTFTKAYFGFLKQLDSSPALLAEARKISWPNVSDDVGDKAFKNVLDLLARDPKIIKEGVDNPEKIKQAATGKSAPFPDLSSYVDYTYAQ